jgi:dsRNA-specific ribonuclease
MNTDDDIRMEKRNGEEYYIFDPYNPLNKMITTEEIQGILLKYGITAPIHNIHLYKRAFIHQSYTKRPQMENENNKIILTEKPAECLPLYTKSNERLEFVGDGVLECITKYYLYRRFPKENEGFMTNKKIDLVKNEAIGKIAYEMGLHKWYILSKHTENKQIRTNMKKLGCLFEAFLGALFLDFNKIPIQDEHGWFENVFITGPGFQMAQVFLENIFEKHVDWTALIRDDTNYKNRLQVIIQKQFKTTPEYKEIDEYHPEYGYTIGVYLCVGVPVHQLEHSQAVSITQFHNFGEIHQYLSVNQRSILLLGEGKHKIKKSAEQMASQMGTKVLSEF